MSSLEVDLTQDYLARVARVIRVDEIVKHATIRYALRFSVRIGTELAWVEVDMVTLLQASNDLERGRKVVEALIGAALALRSRLGLPLPDDQDPGQEEDKFASRFHAVAEEMK